MKLTRLRNAGVLIEEEGTRILCDPWLVQGEYYGAWALYPEPEHEPENFNDVDYLYISHIHPDHCSAKTLARMDTDIPVLIHNFRFDWLKNKLNGLGFDVIELPNGEPFTVGGDLELSIFAADNCNPELCGKLMECSWVDESDDGPENGSAQIDSLAVFHNGDQSIVHVNDAPFELAEHVCHVIRDRFSEVDLLLTPYAGASAYPHCFDNLTSEEKRAEADSVTQKKLESEAANYTRTLDPKYVMPFSGEYVLAGDLAPLNEYLAIAEPHEARDYLVNHPELDYTENECILLNEGEHIDLATGKLSAPYTPPDPEAKQAFIQNGLGDVEFSYASNDPASLEELRELVSDAHGRFESKRQEIGLETETALLVELVDDTYAQVNLMDGGYSFVDDSELADIDKYVRFSAPPKLLVDLLRGPRYAHWNNASIGSHLRIDRQPNRYERGIYYCMNFFHA